MVARWAVKEPRVRPTVEKREGRWRWTGERAVLEERLQIPLHWAKPRVVAVNWLGDLFRVPPPGSRPVDVANSKWAIDRAFRFMVKCRQHQFLVLTKRRGRMLQFGDRWAAKYKEEVLAHIFWGITAWDQPSFNRARDMLGMIPGRTWISLEPLLGPVELSGHPMPDWIVLGAETGPKARPMQPTWAKNVRDQCLRACVPFWLKQTDAKRNRLLDGREWNQAPGLIARTLNEHGIKAEGGKNG